MVETVSVSGKSGFNYLTLLSVQLSSTDVTYGIKAYGKHTATDMQEGST